MNLNNDIFKADCIHLKNENYLHIIQIDEINVRIKKFIDDNISKICNGAIDEDISITKQEIINFLETKKKSNTEKGAIAEFFVHLYLNQKGFNQEFLYLNLEEKSIKKGFDGFYTFNNKEWVYESKSSSISTKNTSHNANVSEAYNDLKNKISGNSTSKNNPWKNAWQHARVVNTEKDVLNNIKKLSDSYVKGIYHKIDDFNIIPSSTIFLENTFIKNDSIELKKKIETLITRYAFKNMNIICLNKKSINLFWEYLNNNN